MSKSITSPDTLLHQHEDVVSMERAPAAISAARDSTTRMYDCTDVAEMPSFTRLQQLSEKADGITHVNIQRPRFPAPTTTTPDPPCSCGTIQLGRHHILVH